MILYQKLPSWLSPQDCAVLQSLSAQPGWIQGRQRSGYDKLDITLQAKAQPFILKALHKMGQPSIYDAWLLRYPTGSSIPPHIDPTTSHKCHVRLNAIITNAKGGQLRLERVVIPLSPRDAYIFRPDITAHSVSPIQEGQRLVLSVGANMNVAQAKKLRLA